MEQMKVINLGNCGLFPNESRAWTLRIGTSGFLRVAQDRSTGTNSHLFSMQLGLISISCRSLWDYLYTSCWCI